MSNCRYTAGHDWYFGDLSMWCRSCWLVKPYDHMRPSARARLTDPVRPPNWLARQRVMSDPSPSVRRLVIDRDGLECRYCGRPVVETMDQRPDMLTLDHLTPRSRGGTNSADNLVVACRTCNGEKGDRLPEHYTPRPYIAVGRIRHRPCRRCRGVHLPHSREPCWPMGRDPDDLLLLGKRVAASLYHENVGSRGKRRAQIIVRAKAALDRRAGKTMKA